MTKKILLTAIAFVIDVAISFIVLFLLIIGFGTTECVRCRVGDDKSIAEMEAACREYIPYFKPMFMAEIVNGLALIVISNYFIFKIMAAKPIRITLIVSLVYLLVFTFIYNSLYQNFIAINLLRLTY
jgi:ABC-type cobalt transport system substrate-binding protein